MLKMIFRYHPALENAEHECRGETAEDATEEKDDDIVKEDCHAGDGVGDAEEAAGGTTAISIC